MSLSTFSKFYFGHTIDTTNYAIDFNEGGSELHADLNPGDYTLTEFAVEVKRALDAAGALTYTVSVNRTTRVLTISATGTFALLAATGTRVGSGAWSLMGFSATDRTAASSYAGQSGSGSEYKPQTILYDHIASEHFTEKNDAVVNESASGKVQVIQFGETDFIQINIRLANNGISNSTKIEYQAAGLTNLIAFMNYAITKAKFEFIPNRDSPGTFYKVLLEKTPYSKNGTGYQLDELKKAPGYFDTGKILLRVTE